MGDGSGRDRPAGTRRLWPWNPEGLHTRIVLVVLVAMVGPAAIFGWAAWVGLTRVSDEVFADRARLARAIADHLDYVVKSDLEILQAIGTPRHADPASAPDADERGAVRDAYLRSHVLESVVLLHDPGTIVWEEPARARGIHAAVAQLPITAEVFRTGKPAASPIVRSAGGARRLYLLVPLRDWQGRVSRVAAGAVDPDSERFRALLRPFRFSERSATDVLDRTGGVLATTNGTQPTIGAAHGRFVEGLVRDHASAVGTCRSCHDAATVARYPAELIAFVPLAVVPWGVSIRQPEDEALGSLPALSGRLVALTTAVLAVGLLFAWGAAGSIRKPLRLLTRAAERIAAGEMAEPIPPLGDDEVGRLGRSLDRMREALKASLDEIGRANVALEGRVEARTRELAHLNEELSKRERSRAELLRKVITAQEEERRRVARELHDETSQSLAALAMSLETVMPVLPPGPARDRVQEAKLIAGRAIEELHRLLFDLRPSVLDDLGLISAIRWCTERHLKPLGITVRCESSGLEQRLPPEIETAIFRVVQEAVTNIAKHAGADTVLIQCASRNGSVTVEIEDDGKGFDPASPGASSSGTGLGLGGMRERVALLGGTLDIESSPDEGTRIALEVPVTCEVARV